jgi:hypothetical protein
VHALADQRVHFLGAVWDQEQLDQLYANCATYLHGHSVGGTNPSLLRAIGAGAAVLAYDVDFNREVTGSAGRYFADRDGVARLIEAAEADPARLERLRRLARQRARGYDWDQVAAGYERLAQRLASGDVPEKRPSGRRRQASAEVLPLRPGVILPPPAAAVDDLDVRPPRPHRSVASGGTQQ